MKYFFSLVLLLSVKCVFAQADGHLIKDIFSPDLKGQVKSFTETIIAGTDTLRVLTMNYSSSGARVSQYIRSNHPELGFSNDSICYKTTTGEIYSVNCSTGVKTHTTISLDANGNTTQVDIAGEKETIGYMPNYNNNGKMDIVYISRSGNGIFQYIGTINYSYNADGSINETNAAGGNEPQGKTKYFYTGKRLTKTIRSGFDGDKTFQIDYSGHDAKGNWTVARYQNGVTVKIAIEYF